MNTIGIITDTNSKLVSFLKQNLETVFKKYAIVNNYNFTNLKKPTL